MFTSTRRCWISTSPNAALDADETVRRLDSGEPRIHIGEEAAWRSVLTVNPMGLHEGQGATVGRRIAEILGSTSREGAEVNGNGRD